MSGKNRTAHRRHIPQRTCVICRRTRAKRGLTRLVYVVDAGIQIDPTGKIAGRGAYLCDDPACWEAASQTDALSQALRVALSANDRAQVRTHAAHLAPIDTTES